MSRLGGRIQTAGMTNDCQVLIVGAGPTGLVLACELLTRGIGIRIIDKGDGVARQSRALGIHARTLPPRRLGALGALRLLARFAAS